MQVQKFQATTGVNYLVSPMDLEKQDIKTIPDIISPYEPLIPSSLTDGLSHEYSNSGFSDTQETQTTSCCLPLGRVDAWVDGGVDTYQKQAQVEAADDLTLLAGVALDREGEESQESISHSSNKPPRLESKKERNRKAANKCRQKSKANIELLKDRERRLSQENKELKSTVYGLRTEVLYLKNEVLMHGANCDYEPIQNYLTRVANGLADRSSP